MPHKPFHFDTAMKELDAITSWFEQSDMPLDEGLTKFERGMELATDLKKHLAQVENRVETIRERFGDSASLTSVPAKEPFDGQSDLLD